MPDRACLWVRVSTDTKGQDPEADYRMIEELGFVVTRDEQATDEPAPPSGQWNEKALVP